MTQQESISLAGSGKGKVYHPLLNVELPGTAELRARCGNSDAMQVLDAACRLADARCRNLNEVRRALSQHSCEPYVGRLVQVDPGLEPELTETDILRALLALQQEYLAAVLFDPLRPQMQPSEPFHRMAEHWREALERCPLPAPGLSVVPNWARRWALMFLENPTLRVEVSTWVCSVMHVMPAELSNVFVAGLFTVDESREQMESAFREHLKKRANPVPPIFPKCPSAYFDRHGLLDAANSLLTASKGIFLLGNDESTLHSLTRAISSDANYCPDLKALEEIRGGGGHRFTTKGLDTRRVSGPDKTVFALTGNVPEEAGGSAWCLDPSSLAYGDQACESLGFFRWLASAGVEAELRFVIAMSMDDWSTLVHAVPEVAGFSRLEVPAAQDLDVIPAFLVLLPEVLERHNCLFPLGLLLDFLYQASLSNPGDLAIGHARDLIYCVKPERKDLGLLSVLPSLNRTPFEQLSHRSFPIRLRVRPVESMADAAEGFFPKYIGDLSRLESLIVLYETVTLLSEPEACARVLGRKADSVIASGTEVGPTISPGYSESKTRSPPSSSRCSYARAVSALPLPTAAQTARFASFVAEAHSWYKHLPLHPMTAFFFFLDPMAGMNGQMDSQSAIAPFDRDAFDESEYRERFGFWNYQVDSSHTTLRGIDQLRRAGTPVDRYNFASRVRDPDGNALKIPSGVMLEGMAKLSAFVHHACALHIWIDRVGIHKSWNPFTFRITLDQAPGDLSEGLRAIWACLNTPNWYPPFESRLLAEYDADVAALAAHPDSPTSWREESAVMKMARELGGEHLYEKALFAVEMRRTISSRNEAFDLYLGSTPSAGVRDLIDRLVYERMRQIESMKDAMRRFLGCLS